MNDDFEFGTLRVTVGSSKSEQTAYTLAIDRLACHENGLIYMLGVIGPAGTVKSLRATLNAKVQSDYAVDNVRITTGRKSGWSRRFHTEEKQKFEMQVHHLGYGQVHALFMAIDPGFMRVISDEAIFQTLKQPTYTTPLLRSWVPQIASDLDQMGLITRLYCFRCQCAVVTAKDEDLDKVVSEGVKNESLKFKELKLVEAVA